MVSYGDLARKYGITRQAVHQIVHRQTWKEVPDLPPLPGSVGAYDGLQGEGFDYECELKTGELGGVLVMELIYTEEGFLVDIKSATADTSRPMNKEQKLELLNKALELVKQEQQ